MCFMQVFIDFGLSSSLSTVEDKGVDLYVLERAIASAHKEGEAEGFVCSVMITECVHVLRVPITAYVRACACVQFDAILAAYLAAVSDSDAIRGKFEQVRMRGRKRLAFG